MRKSLSRNITYKQYRTTDLFLFAAILAIAEFCGHYAAVWFPSEALYTFSFMLPITLIVMMRWGWQSAIFCVGSGILNCALNGGSFTAYLTYCIGNLFVMFMLLPLKKIGKRKIASKWYLSALFVLCGWLCVYLGRSCVWTVCYMITPVEGSAIYSGFVQFAAWDLLSLAMAIAIILVMRRFDGMFEDQMDYLKRLDEEKKQKMMGDAFGDTPIEIDKQTLDILNKDNDLY